MLNGQRQGAGINIFTPVVPAWKLVGAGDFNGDGTDDILWQHVVGQVHFWPIVNGQRQGGVDIFTRSYRIGGSWASQASIDLPGDGRNFGPWHGNEGARAGNQARAPHSLAQAKAASIMRRIRF